MPLWAQHQVRSCGKLITHGTEHAYQCIMCANRCLCLPVYTLLRTSNFSTHRKQSLVDTVPNRTVPVHTSLGLNWQSHVLPRSAHCTFWNQGMMFSGGFAVHIAFRCLLLLIRVLSTQAALSRTPIHIRASGNFQPMSYLEPILTC
jgi:hypothetical protein